jgi:hypothetical protein
MTGWMEQAPKVAALKSDCTWKMFTILSSTMVPFSDIDVGSAFRCLLAFPFTTLCSLDSQKVTPNLHFNHQL